MSLSMYVACTDSIPVRFFGVLEDFCEKERYESFSVQRTFTADTFRKVCTDLREHKCNRPNE
jgi:hypothetical protein